MTPGSLSACDARTTASHPLIDEGTHELAHRQTKCDIFDLYGGIYLRRHHGVQEAIECGMRSQKTIDSADLIYLIEETIACLSARHYSLSEDIKGKRLVAVS